MKRIALCLMLCIASVEITGCGTNQQTATYQTIASIQLAVKSSLNAWCEYVILQRKANESLPEGIAKSTAIANLAANEQKVRLALIKYQQACAFANLSVSTITGGYSKDSAIKLGNEFIKTVSLIIE